MGNGPLSPRPYLWILRTGLILRSVFSIAFGSVLLRARSSTRAMMAGMVVFRVSTAILGLTRDFPIRGGSAMCSKDSVHSLSPRTAIYGIWWPWQPSLLQPSVAAAGLFYPGVPLVPQHCPTARTAHYLRLGAYFRGADKHNTGP